MSRVEQRRRAAKAEILDAAWTIARANGLGDIGMRELASSLGMAASSLYGYFDSKHAIYDAMFIEGNNALGERFGVLSSQDGRRESLIATAREFISFCDEDHARFQLLFQHSIPGWQPTPDAYATAVANYERMRSHLAALGIDSDESADLWTAIVSGLASQQVANDPGGDRWLRLAERAVDMFLNTEGGRG